MCKSQHRLGLGRSRRDIPFFVQLRKLGRDVDRHGGLTEYMIQRILVSGAGMEVNQATEFLQYALAAGRALVMLDGLDEVTTDRYPAILEAVNQFIADRNPQQPTHLARIVVTCRRQNLIPLRDEWVPVIAKTVSTLAPLRNSEIFSYLNKLRTKFKAAGGPESFMNAVRTSGTLDLHRIPLILAMSVGLYARKDFYDIPNSIAKLYQTMIEEMLDRQRFKRDPGGAALVLQVADKYRFLREFALARALGTDGFDDFERGDMLAFATTLAPSLRAVHDPSVLVAEIADRSGLVSDVSEAGRYVFAHRSLHEYLAAEELLSVVDGDSILLARANDREWRQVILFYATALEQRRADDFLPALAACNVTLAGHCLASTLPSDGVAEAILDQLLSVVDPQHLAALVAATTSPRRAVQNMAVSRLEIQLNTSMHIVRSTLSGDVDGMLPLLGALAGSNAARIAALVPQIVVNIPDDPRLVEPLWRCLAAPGIEREPACRTIVERLLTIAMDIDGFLELQKQEPYTREFLDQSVRRAAYPFEDGLPITNNVVTLLAWAEFLDVQASVPNRFFEAKAVGQLGRIETDRRRTIVISPYRFGLIGSLAIALAALAALTAVVAIDWRLFFRPFSWWTPLISVGLAVLAYLAGFRAPYTLGERAPEGSRRRRFLSNSNSSIKSGHITEHLPNDTLEALAVLGAPIIFAVAVPCLVPTPLSAYFAINILPPALLWWSTFLPMFQPGVRLYLYRPNEFTDMYDDPRSRLWLTREVTPNPVSADSGIV